MNRTHLSVLAVALLAASATANATIWEVTLTKVMLGSDGRAATELKINPAPSFPADTPQIPLPIMRYNDATTTLTMTGKLDLRSQTTPTTGGRLFDHYITNLVINGATGDTSGTTSYTCENHPTTGTAAGGFGQNVGANMCGNYTLGDDYVDNSTLAYSGLTVTRTIAGDDAVSGDPQSIATYALLTQNFTAGPGGTLVMQSADWNATSSAGLQMTFSVGAVVGGGAGQGYPVKLVKYYQQGTSVARWDGCSDYTQFSNCIKPGTTLANLGVTPSTATWNWDPATGILSSVGDFNSASTISSQAASQVVIGDSVTDLVINTTTGVTTASAYHCIEGTFLATVGANGCLNTSTGDDFTNDSSAVYNVGGDATCIKVTIGGDDSAMEGAPRGVTTRAASVNCDATDGAFGPWSVAEDLTASGGQLKISNGPLDDANTGVLIFDTLPHAVDDTADAIPTVAKQIDVLANDVALADPVTVAINTAPTKGTATVVGSPGNAASVHINYTGNSDATGTDTFTYDVTTGSTTSTGTVTVTLLDDGAKDDTVTTHRNVPVTINVAANDLGFSGSPQLGLYVNPLHGAASVVGAAIRYVSDPDFVGTDTFKYIIDDGTHVGIATVTVHVIDDADNDGIPDDMDNCLGRANADQRDTDGDGFGNVCDADLDNSGTVNFGDLAIFHKRFGTSDPDADFDGNGVVNFADLARFRALFGRPPGPAGSPPAF